MPACSRVDNGKNIIGLSYTGKRHFGVDSVAGYSLVPRPPARIMPFITDEALFEY
ncbi:hypothetical protein SDC9_156545 [bioreactor metagenome]|uniref:Uncharacterized protein n=1 Tax=bioreactor metagenome TaxID=1076179 RepID=A0A645F6J3_9ZZZZ